MWTKVKETLSDCSAVFNVSNSDGLVIHALDESSAIEIEECLNKNSVDWFMRAREIKKQLQVLTSQYDRDKASYDALKDKDGVIARHYKSRMDKTLRQITNIKGV